MTRFTLLSLLAFLLYSGCHWKFTQYRRSDESYKMKMLYPVRKWSITYGNAEGIKLRFISVGDTSLPVLVLIHGSPGSIVTFEPFLMDTGITNHVRLIAMDRPGYGYSGLGKPDTSILHQADLIYSILHNDLDLNKYSVMGYSYGGSVAATLAAIDNKKVQRLILVSASLEPDREKTYGISHVIKTKVFSPLCPKIYRSANKEKLSHKAALCNVTSMYSDIKCKVLMYQGANDPLIYPENATYMKQKLTAADTVILRTRLGGHRAYIWDQQALLKKEILRFVLRP